MVAGALLCLENAVGISERLACAINSATMGKMGKLEHLYNSCGGRYWVRWETIRRAP